MSKLLVVKKGVVNLRKERDGEIETQLLLGEQLLSSKREGDWFFVHAPYQVIYEKEWSGYPGWVHESDVMEVSHSQDDTVIVKRHGVRVGNLILSMGTTLEVVDGRVMLGEEFVGEIGEEDYQDLNFKGEREGLVEVGKSFLDTPYLWGGKSSFLPEVYKESGVDCSGLTFLAHSLVGINIPRNAHDQYMRCLKIEREELEMGDLVFTAKLSNRERITHVLIYIDRDTLLEASSTSGKVQLISLDEKLGGKVEHGEKGPKSYVFYGSYFH